MSGRRSWACPGFHPGERGTAETEVERRSERSSSSDRLQLVERRRSGTRGKIRSPESRTQEGAVSSNGGALRPSRRARNDVSPTRTRRRPSASRLSRAPALLPLLHASAIAYGRPFSDNHPLGALPRRFSTFDDARLVETHDLLLDLRNKFVAHSDQLERRVEVIPPGYRLREDLPRSVGVGLTSGNAACRLSNSVILSALPTKLVAESTKLFASTQLGFTKGGVYPPSPSNLRSMTNSEHRRPQRAAARLAGG